MAANGKTATSPIGEQIRAVILTLTLAATEAQREKPKEQTPASEAEEKEIAALQALLKSDPHLSKLCEDGFGIPGVKLIAHITGKPYLLRAFPDLKARKDYPPFVALKDTKNALHLVSQPYDNTSSYTIKFGADGAVGYPDNHSVKHDSATPASDEEIKAMIAKIPDDLITGMLAHSGMGKVLRPAVFGTKPAEAAAAK